MNYENYPAHLKGAVDYLIDGLGGMGERIVAVLTIMIDQLAHKYALDYEVSNVAQRRDVLEKVVDIVERYPDLTEQQQFDILDFAESHYIWKIDLVRVRLAGTRELSPVEALLGRLNTGFLTIKSTNVPELADVGFDQLCRAFEVTRRGRSFASTRGEEYAGRGNRDDDRYDGSTKEVIFGRRSMPFMELGQSLRRPGGDFTGAVDHLAELRQSLGNISEDKEKFFLDLCGQFNADALETVRTLEEMESSLHENPGCIYPRAISLMSHMSKEQVLSCYLQPAFQETIRKLNHATDLRVSDESIEKIVDRISNEWGLGKHLVRGWLDHERNPNWLKWLADEVDNTQTAVDLITDITRDKSINPPTLEAVLDKIHAVNSTSNLFDAQEIEVFCGIVQAFLTKDIDEVTFVMKYGHRTLYRALELLKGLKPQSVL